MRHIDPRADGLAQHVELGLVPEGVTVRDLGSRNGTFYQGQRVEKMVLALGGRLSVGAATVSIDADTESLVQHLDYAGSSYRGMVGVSRAMRQLFAILSRLEGSLATVLIEGESGVGKELGPRPSRGIVSSPTVRSSRSTADSPARPIGSVFVTRRGALGA